MTVKRIHASMGAPALMASTITSASVERGGKEFTATSVSLSQVFSIISEDSYSHFS